MELRVTLDKAKTYCPLRLREEKIGVSVKIY